MKTQALDLYKKKKIYNKNNEKHENVFILIQLIKKLENKKILDNKNRVTVTQQRSKRKIFMSHMIFRPDVPEVIISGDLFIIHIFLNTYWQISLYCWDPLTKSNDHRQMSKAKNIPYYTKLTGGLFNVP